VLLQDFPLFSSSCLSLQRKSQIESGTVIKKPYLLKASIQETGKKSINKMTMYNGQKDLEGGIFLCGHGFKQFAAYFCYKM